MVYSEETLYNYIVKSLCLCGLYLLTRKDYANMILYKYKNKSLYLPMIVLYVYIL